MFSVASITLDASAERYAVIMYPLRLLFPLPMVTCDHPLPASETILTGVPV